jgi:hypothetical protein
VQLTDKITNNPQHPHRQSLDAQLLCDVFPIRDTANYSVKPSKENTCAGTQWDTIHNSEAVEQTHILIEPPHQLVHTTEQSKDEESLNVINSDHPDLRDLGSGELMHSHEKQKPKEVYHDVSSIDIYISSSGFQSPPSHT